MEYSILGKSKLKVSRIALGSWQFGSQAWGLKDKETIRKIVYTAIENGINFIDTAEVYGDGFSEDMIGSIIKEMGIREDIVIATKVSPSHLKFKDVIKSLEKSLERLKTSYVDLYQIHWPNMYIPVKETIRALEKLADEGKIRFIGLSNFPSCLAEEAVYAAKRHEIISNQVRYNLIQREIEASILPKMRELGIVILAYSPLAKGLLTGKYDQNNLPPENDFRSKDPLFVNKENMTQIMNLINKLRELGEKYGKNPAQVAINWLLKNDDVFPIIGAKKPDHVLSNIGSVGWRLSEEDWNSLKEISDKLDLTYHL